MSYSFWRPQPWRPGALAPLCPLATPLRLVLFYRRIVHQTQSRPMASVLAIAELEGAHQYKVINQMSAL